jgi:hypothetical protein
LAWACRAESRKLRKSVRGPFDQQFAPQFARLMARQFEPWFDRLLAGLLGR